MLAAVTSPRARPPQRSTRDDHEPPFLPRPARSCVGRATHGARGDPVGEVVTEAEP